MLNQASNRTSYVLEILLML